MAKVLIVGDFAPKNRLIKALSDNNTDIFGGLRQLIDASDFSVVNLEMPVTDIDSPILKTGPNLRCTLNELRPLKEVGFNLVTLANNHMLDQGVRGLKDTILNCHELGIATVGAGMNLEDARKIHLQVIGNIKVAFINVCENEWSTTHDDTPGCNPISEINLWEDIKTAKRQSDVTVVIIHGGHEWYGLPSPRMVKLYRWLVEIGADAVIGHHTHCFSGHEIYKNKPIVYSLGNFLFDKPYRKTIWNIGAAAFLEIKDADNIDISLYPFNQCDDSPTIDMLGGDNLKEWQEEAKQKTRIIKNDAELKSEFEKFSAKIGKSFVDSLEPFDYKIISAARSRGLFPRVLSQHQKTLLLNIARDEAHRDVLISYLTKLYNDENCRIK